MSFCDVSLAEVIAGEKSIILPPGKIDAFNNTDNAPLDHFEVSASHASAQAAGLNAAVEAARIRELTQKRRDEREAKLRAFRAQLAKRAASIQRSMHDSRAAASPRLSHHDLSRLVVRGSHIEPSDVSFADAEADGEYTPGGGDSYLPGGPLPQAPEAQPVSQAEAELTRLSALTPVLLDQQRIHVALEAQRARAALASYAQGTPPQPAIPMHAAPMPPAGAHDHAAAPQPPQPPARRLAGQHHVAFAADGQRTQQQQQQQHLSRGGRSHGGHSHGGHSHGHGHENCVPQWNSLPENWRELNRQRAVHSIVEARRVYMDRERRVVRAKVAKQRRAERARRAREAAARRQAADEMEARMRAAALAAAQQEQEDNAAAAEQAQQDAEEQRRVQAKRREDDGRRFIEALRRQAMDKIRQRGITLPPMCKCTPGASIFAPQWETCANNCEFYHNPAAYTRALADLFQTLDLLD